MEDKAESIGKRNEYHAFMLRLRRRGTEQRWFLTLEDPHTRKQRNFKNLEMFVLYLLTLIGQEEFDLDQYRRLRKRSR